MDNIIKSFSFTSENITLTLNLMKQVSTYGIHMYMLGDLVSSNDDLILNKKKEKDYEFFYLNFKGADFLFIGNLNTREKGVSQFIWNRITTKRNQDFKVGIYRYNNVKEFTEKYVKMREYISVISDYFYLSIKNYKEKKLLYETDIDDVYSEK